MPNMAMANPSAVVTKLPVFPQSCLHLPQKVKMAAWRVQNLCGVAINSNQKSTELFNLSCACAG